MLDGNNTTESWDLEPYTCLCVFFLYVPSFPFYLKLQKTLFYNFLFVLCQKQIQFLINTSIQSRYPHYGKSMEDVMGQKCKLSALPFFSFNSENICLWMWKKKSEFIERIHNKRQYWERRQNSEIKVKFWGEKTFDYFYGFLYKVKKEENQVRAVEK